MEIQVGDKMMEVTLLQKEGNHVKIDIDGKVYDVDVCMLEKNICSIIHKGTSYNAELTKENDGKHYRVNLNYSVYDIDMLDSQAKYMRMRRSKAGGSGSQADTITAPMPCKIVKVFVKPGDELKAGDSVLTMEAMKMQSNYKVAEDCTIKEVLVSEGDSVMANATLVTLNV
ncbi:MAG: acetyl-CoA carboxylase biotin carboxyl carrier protein subunit [Prevotella sp.]|nr:acetyl-CoA carboxylase biotin carboxyl carrier protein subunit [Prevotella sp.]MBQ9560788.1 acetyl-CoA carboxylase biotin carboxyl carrier protein subunit [Prevotella sp.]MBR1839397.1 acetyl-CoA carboxylase biotin carboxyl carrier protein subunit [Prevotella sp.]